MFPFEFMTEKISAYLQMPESYTHLEEVIASYSLNVVYIAIVLLVILAVISLKVKHISSNARKLLFWSIVGVITSCTLFLVSSTIYLNSVSSSEGPVHWHADFEVWICGSELDLKDPVGLSNKIGTPTFHEHSDKRIHLEGVVVTPIDASLGKFFKVIGGNLENDAITIPTTNGIVTYKTGDLCPDGTQGVLQAYVYKTIEGMYIQRKLTDLPGYIITGEGGVPPGDCIIIEFGEEKAMTDKLCRSYKVAETIGKIRKGF